MPVALRMKANSPTCAMAKPVSRAVRNGYRRSSAAIEATRAFTSTVPMVSRTMAKRCFHR